MSTEYVKISRVYLNGGLPVADVQGPNGYVWRSIKILAGGQGNSSSCMYFPPLSGLGIVQRFGASTFLNCGVPTSPAGNSLFEDRTDDVVSTSELPEKCTVHDAVICNGSAIFKVDANGNVCIDSRRAGTPIRLQIDKFSKVMVIMSEPGAVDSADITEGLLLANRTLTYINEQLTVKLIQTQTACTVLQAALQAGIAAAPSGAQAMAAAIQTALLAYQPPQAPDYADVNLVSAAFAVSDISQPEVEDTYLFGDDGEE